jgi:hypothetical protein
MDRGSMARIAGGDERFFVTIPVFEIISATFDSSAVSPVQQAVGAEE